MSRISLQSMLMNNETPALVIFYAPWCSYCQSYLPVFEGIVGGLAGRIQLIKVNVDRNVAAALRYGIRATPTFMYSYKGQVLWKKQGKLSKDELSEKILNLLALEGVY